MLGVAGCSFESDSDGDSQALMSPAILKGFSTCRLRIAVVASSSSRRTAWNFIACDGRADANLVLAFICALELEG